MKIFLAFYFLFLFHINVLSQNNGLNSISEALLSKVIENTSFEKELESLRKMTFENLKSGLKNDEAKIAFWVNIYNAFIIITLRKNPDSYINRSAFFSKKQINIAGLLLSFDDIEHGILRRSKIKVSLGYLNKWIVDDWEKQLRVDQLDWRIHFALNCGAKSCPPVAIYSPETIDKQFEKNTRHYLKQQTNYDLHSKTVTTTVLFSWFQGDFGGLADVKVLLKDYGIVPEIPKKIRFSDYDWTIDLDNFVE